MKNITVSIPEDVYRRARVRAAERGTSVSALVAGFLASLDDRDAERKRLERQQEEIVAKIKRFSASTRLSRDELHQRGLR